MRISVKTTFFALLTVIQAYAAQELPEAVSVQPITVPVTQLSPATPLLETFPKQGFIYFRFTTAEGDFSRPDLPVPGIGIGYRRFAGNGAMDISSNGNGIAAKNREFIHWSVPKITYIRYLTPTDETSVYAGGGLAWGGMSRHSTKTYFVGLVPSATIGYEFLRKNGVLGFTELSISQPALPVYNRGPFPGPNAEISLGAGF